MGEGKADKLTPLVSDSAPMAHRAVAGRGGSTVWAGAVGPAARESAQMLDRWAGPKQGHEVTLEREARASLSRSTPLRPPPPDSRATETPSPASAPPPPSLLPPATAALLGLGCSWLRPSPRDAPPRHRLAAASAWRLPASRESATPAVSPAAGRWALRRWPSSREAKARARAAAVPRPAPAQRCAARLPPPFVPVPRVGAAPPQSQPASQVPPPPSVPARRPLSSLGSNPSSATACTVCVRRPLKGGIEGWQRPAAAAAHTPVLIMRHLVRNLEFLGQHKQVLLCSDEMASALTSVSNWLLLNSQLDLNSREEDVAMVSVTEFQDTEVYRFFCTLKIPLFHADTFSEQVISTLIEQLEQDVGILYLDRKFHTICKVNQKEKFVASDFSKIVAGINDRLLTCSRPGCSESFCTGINYGRHCNAHLLAKSNPIYSLPSLVKYWDEISYEEAYSILSDGDKAVKEKKLQSGDLVDILQLASEGTLCTTLLKETKLFVEEDNCENKLRSMLACFSLGVEKSVAKRYHDRKKAQADAAADKLLIEEVCNEASRQMKVSKDDESSQCFDHKDVASTALEASSSSSEADEVQVSVDKEVLKDENCKLLPSDIAHMPPLAEIKFILKIHKGGHCWNGDWNILDIRVQGNGSTLIINKTPITATKDGMVQDLTKFIKVLHPYYKLEGIKGPAYFDEFQSDALRHPDLDSEELDLFWMFMAYHMAFMPPLPRSNLIEKLFQICDDIRGDRQEGYEPLSNILCHGWMKINQYHPYSRVFFFIPIPAPYQGNFWDLLRFLRNFLNHALQYTKVDGVQVIEDIAVLDLMIAHDLGSHITRLLLDLLYGIENENRKRDETEENDEDI
ncbi:hypothetical protein U9M48_026216 [Paspalum notatum var. saurae]|uniref:C2H2-type domain-containing protein n=1 Tax=Paspalum notatum var. saurae TaxID=547442 RepID=A0AAQ3TRW7_PASNO